MRIANPDMESAFSTLFQPCWGFLLAASRFSDERRHPLWFTMQPLMKVVASNKKARFDYQIDETVEAGIMLTGQEAKSCRLGHVDMGGAYLSFRGMQPVIKQLKIMPYKFASGLVDYDPARERTLLLTKKQIETLQSRVVEKGVAVIPLEVKAGRFIKLTFGIGRGRKKHDKRARIKERDVGRRLREGREI
jgi:SsrA-binding protein